MSLGETMLPVSRMFPMTSNFSVGEFVPIPTLPSAVVVTTEIRLKDTGVGPSTTFVPSFVVILTFEAPAVGEFLIFAKNKDISVPEGTLVGEFTV